jgi:hypothetical protein|tara:strand:+ start:162 stop:341 length:180 start_codon:yes stop_codon:yes gene_type:complete
MKGVKHYKKDGTVHKGEMHKMKDGSLHTGKTHTKTSKPLFHLNELSKKAQAKAKGSKVK